MTIQTSKQMTNLRYLLILSLALLWAGCEKEQETPDPIPTEPLGQGVFILNEGNFMAGNASLSYLDTQSGQVMHGLFQQANNESLGDVLQSMIIHQERAYLVVNNSGKIEVTDPESMDRVGTINGFVSPRYMLGVNEQKAYVTDLFGNSITVVDLVGNAISGGIAVGGWTEELAIFAGQVVVAGAGSGYLYFLDPQTDVLTDSLYLGASPSRLRIDAEGHLWVLCSGSWDGSENPKLVRIRPQRTGMKEAFPLPEANSYYSRLDISADGRSLFVLGQDVWMMDLGQKNPAFELWIESGGMTFYGLSVSPFDDRLYLTDAVDFVQRGTLMVYSETGQALGSHLVMVNPSGLYHH